MAVQHQPLPQPPLQGKAVLVWPDRDKPGWEYAMSAAQALLTVGAASCSTAAQEACTSNAPYRRVRNAVARRKIGVEV